jgi:hypothetical protein
MQMGFVSPLFLAWQTHSATRFKSGFPVSLIVDNFHLQQGAGLLITESNDSA